MSLSRDTDPIVEDMLFERWRRLSPREKAAIVSAWCRAAQDAAIAGIRERHPEASDREIRLRLASLRLDRETMIRVFGWDPQAMGYG